MSWKNNPWARESKLTRSGYTVCCDATSRIEQIRRSEDVDWLKRVAGWAENQKSVQVAVQRRLKKLSQLRAFAPLR